VIAHLRAISFVDYITFSHPTTAEIMEMDNPLINDGITFTYCACCRILLDEGNDFQKNACLQHRNSCYGITSNASADLNEIYVTPATALTCEKCKLQMQLPEGIKEHFDACHEYQRKEGNPHGKKEVQPTMACAGSSRNENRTSQAEDGESEDNEYREQDSQTESDSKWASEEDDSCDTHLDIEVPLYKWRESLGNKGLDRVNNPFERCKPSPDRRQMARDKKRRDRVARKQADANQEQHNSDTEDSYREASNSHKEKRELLDITNLGSDPPEIRKLFNTTFLGLMGPRARREETYNGDGFDSEESAPTYELPTYAKGNINDDSSDDIVYGEIPARAKTTGLDDSDDEMNRKIAAKELSSTKTMVRSTSRAKNAMVLDSAEESEDSSYMGLGQKSEEELSDSNDKHNVVSKSRKVASDSTKPAGDEPIELSSGGSDITYEGTSDDEPIFVPTKKPPPKVTPATKKKEARKKLKLARENKRHSEAANAKSKWGGCTKLAKAMNWSESSGSSSSDSSTVKDRNLKRKPDITVEDLGLSDSTDTSTGIDKQTDKRKRLRKQQPSGDNEVRGIKRYSHGST
jgi:hypothetical protein